MFVELGAIVLVVTSIVFFQVLFAAVACLFRSGSATYSQHSAGFAGPVGYNGPHAVPVVLPSGHIADTQEVAAARNAHYAALFKAQATSGYGGDEGSASAHGGAGAGAVYGGNAYNGPLAAPVVLSNGYLADTREVADAKNAHFSALQTAKASSGFGSGYGSGYGAAAVHGGDAGATFGGSAYHGPLAAPVVLPSGFIADTEAVAAAKGAHLSALSQASASAGYHSAGSANGKHW